MANTKLNYITIDSAQDFHAPTDIYARAANWELAGLSDDAYRLSAASQRLILGFYVGKGRVYCDWDRKRAYNIIKCCFGLDTTYGAEYCLQSGEKIIYS